MGFNYNDLARRLTGDVPIFGFASDGDHTVAGTETLTQVAEYRDLTVPAGTILNTGCFMIYVNGTLTIEEGGIIQANGNAASGATGGAVLGGSANTYSGSQGFDGDIAGPATYFTEVGTGGDAGNAGAGAGGAGQVTTGNSIRNQKLLTTMPGLLIPSGVGSGTNRAGIGAPGGSGDGSANFGGGGGGGGGTVWIVAATVINQGTIRALGGAGGAGTATDCGGGGGGGGGLIKLVARSYMGSGTLDVSGGAGGASGGGSGVAGVAGSDGRAFTFIVP